MKIIEKAILKNKTNRVKWPMHLHFIESNTIKTISDYEIQHKGNERPDDYRIGVMGIKRWNNPNMDSYTITMNDSGRFGITQTMNFLIASAEVARSLEVVDNKMIDNWGDKVSLKQINLELRLATENCFAQCASVPTGVLKQVKEKFRSALGFVTAEKSKRYEQENKPVDAPITTFYLNQDSDIESFMCSVSVLEEFTGPSASHLTYYKDKKAEVCRLMVERFEYRPLHVLDVSLNRAIYVMDLELNRRKKAEKANPAVIADITTLYRNGEDGASK